MRKFLALIGSRNKEFYRDRSALIWSLVFPVIVLAGFTYGYSGRQEPILKIGTYPESLASEPLARGLTETPGIVVQGIKDESEAARKIERYQLDLLVRATAGGKLEYSFHEDAPKGKLAQRLLEDARARLPEGSRPTLEFKKAEGRQIRYVDWLLPGLLAMNIMFGSMFGVGYVIVRYRKNGVLKRLRATPLSALQFLTAQVVSRVLLMIVTSLIVIVGAIPLIGFHLQGGWIDAIIFLTVSSAAMISVGLVVASRISTEEVAEGVLNLMTWPMIFLSGVWFSLEGASPWVAIGAKLMPLTHVVNGLRAILIDGATLAQVFPELIALVILTAVLTVISSFIFRWR